MDNRDLTQLSIIEASQGLRAGDFSARQLTEACLGNINQKDQELGSFLSVFKDEALDQAQLIDRSLSSRKELPPLAGIPIAIKDNILIHGHRCSSASNILKKYSAAYDATVIQKLRQQGAIFIGKTNLDEFAMGSSTENSAFQVTYNPHDLERVPGGSSGGSAAAVAAGEALAALGSDTGGSIRQPAAFCGLVGLKPTYGAVSRYGLMAFASSFDQIGPLTKTSQDSRLVFRSIRGQDPMDLTSREGYFNKKTEISKLRVGVPEQCFGEGISSEMVKWTEKTIDYLKDQGARIVSLDLSGLDYSLPVYYVVATAEASANLARYDGLRYGEAETAKSLQETYARTRSQGFGMEVKRRIMLGSYTLSAGHYDAYYQQAQKARKVIEAEFQKALVEVDLILTPTTPGLPFKIGDRIDNPVEMYLSDLLTVSANLTGLPAVSIPVGREGKLPVGMQLIGPSFSEDFLLQIGSHLEWLS